MRAETFYCRFNSCHSARSLMMRQLIHVELENPIIDVRKMVYIFTIHRLAPLLPSSDAAWRHGRQYNWINLRPFSVCKILTVAWAPTFCIDMRRRLSESGYYVQRSNGHCKHTNTAHTHTWSAEDDCSTTSTLKALRVHSFPYPLAIRMCVCVCNRICETKNSFPFFSFPPVLRSLALRSRCLLFNARCR